MCRRGQWKLRPVSRAFCDIYIGRGGRGVLWRGETCTRILAEMDARCIAWIFGVSIDFHFALLMIPDRGEPQSMRDRVTERDRSFCSALGPFVRHCSMMSRIYAWEGAGRERIDCAWLIGLERSSLRIGLFKLL